MQTCGTGKLTGPRTDSLIRGTAPFSAARPAAHGHRQVL